MATGVELKRLLKSLEMPPCEWKDFSKIKSDFNDPTLPLHADLLENMVERSVKSLTALQLDRNSANAPKAQHR